MRSIDAGVINMSTVKPLDTETLISVSKACRLVTAEEHSTIGGLGSASVSSFRTPPTKIIRIGIKDDFGCSGTSEELKTLRSYS
jgi:transketolase